MAAAIFKILVLRVLAAFKTASPPIPAPLEKVAGMYRFQLHIQAQDRRVLHQYLAQMVDYLSTSKLAQKVRWSLDVDPIDMI